MSGSVRANAPIFLEGSVPAVRELSRAGFGLQTIANWTGLSDEVVRRVIAEMREARP